MPIRVGTRRYPILAGGIVAVKYLLRATFDDADQGFANGQVLDTRAEGVQDGTLTCVIVDGTLAIVSNKCAFTAPAVPAIGVLGFYSQAITRALGRGLFSTGNVATVKTLRLIQWQDAGDITAANVVYASAFAAATGFSVVVLDGAGNVLENVVVAAYSIATDYQLAIVLGGYDAANGVPWRSGQAAASYLYGAAFFAKGGALSNWTLIWRTSQVNIATLYAGASNYDAAGTVDNFRIPDADLSAVLQPTCLSLFASDGELDAYVPELGSAWAEDIGDWDTASGTLKATALGIATFTGLADCLYDAKITTPASGTTAGGLVLRVTDLTGASEDYWYVKVTPGTAGTDWELIEYVAGTPTQRAFGDADWAAATAYQIRAICYGATIDCFNSKIATGNKITYASATSGQTATKIGLRDEGNANMTFDNVAVSPRTSSVYDSVLGGV